jgi:molybdopterin-guanine dinucleotide biosynthesis protein A
MGSPKALLDFGGKPLWRWQAEKLQALRPAELFISTPRGLELKNSPGVILYDEAPSLGPLAGLCAAAQVLTADWLVVLGIDLPAMSSDYLRGLLDTATTSGLGQVPELDGYYAGLVAVYPRDFLGQTPRFLANPDRSLQRFVREGLAAGSLVIRSVLETERPLFFNMNEPGDYETARARPTSTQ